VNRIERRAAKKTQSPPTPPPPPTAALVEAKPRSELRLDLGCGQTPREGFEGVDLRGLYAKHAVDLFKFPWPFESESVDELYSSHLVEHIPAREIEARDIRVALGPLGVIDNDASEARADRFVGQDMFFAFMDECYRIMKTDAWMTVVVPSGRSNRAFMDPTHRRFLMQETFLYLAEEWRVRQKLDHYIVHTNFGIDVGHTMPQEEGLRSSDAQKTRIDHYWNTTVDWVAKLKKMPRATAEQLKAWRA
jgi:predicted SAM-dependent methyltransferase